MHHGEFPDLITEATKLHQFKSSPTLAEQGTTISLNITDATEGPAIKPKVDSWKGPEPINRTTYGI